jgi:hypothetical protein
VKKTLVRKKKAPQLETMRPEYRFAGKMSEGAVVVVLEPDVAAVFQSPEVV